MTDQSKPGSVGQIFHRGVGDVLNIGLMLDGKREEGKPVDQSGELAALFTERVGIPTDDIFAFPLQPSTQATDSYSTRMTRGSLENYRRNAIAGVPFMNSHRTGDCFADAELPLGQSFDGRLVGEPLDETSIFSLDEIPDSADMDVDLLNTGMRLQTWDYMKRGLFPNGRNQPGTDDVISMIESKTLRQVSIGFGHAAPDRLLYRCGLCGNRMGQKSENSDLQCDHVPGFRDKETGHVAFAWVENGQMYEKSGVWAGATPGAVVGNAPGPLVLQARIVAKNGMLTLAEADRIEELYQKKVRPGQSFPMPDTRKPSEVNAMADEQDVKGPGEEEQIDGEPCSKTEIRTVKESMADILAALKESTRSNVQLMTNLVDSNAALVEALEERSDITVTLDEDDLLAQINDRFAVMQAEIGELRNASNKGTVTARELWIKRAIEATVRAEGAENTDVDTLKTMWAALDDKQLLQRVESIELRNPFVAGRQADNPDEAGNGNRRGVNPAHFKV